VSYQPEYWLSGQQESALRYEPDPDAERELAWGRQQERIDRGDECPACHADRGIKRLETFAGPIFECRCGERWFDFLTRPSAP
jgi:hypothetical protein